MKLGEERITREICCERECAECGEPAQWKHTFLLIGSRKNPHSSAYGKDDCSWCSDEDIFACDEHKELLRKNPPQGMSWCSTFDRKVFEHMFLIWKKVISK